MIQSLIEKACPAPLYKFVAHGKQEFECPICFYAGPFMDMRGFAGVRKHAICPNCKSLERHRMQALVILKAISGRDPRTMACLHFAPEPCMTAIMRPAFRPYHTADLEMKGVDYKADLLNLPFADQSYDFVLASHVLEHIQDDSRAVSEIRRILRPGGMAILPVPIVCEKTFEYSAPVPSEAGHVRSPGRDYYTRYLKSFRRIEIFSSDDFPAKYQTYAYEDRSVWPTKNCPMREPALGEKHADYVPVCYV